MKRTTAADLIEEGTAFLDAIAAELPTHDAPAQRQALNDGLDGWIKDNANRIADLSDDEQNDVECTLADHCGSLHEETSGSIQMTTKARGQMPRDPELPSEIII